MSRHVILSVDRAHGALQLSINVRDEGGGGHGYRFCGPKYDGTSTNILTYKLDRRDIEEIQRYLALNTDTDDG